MQLVTDVSYGSPKLSSELLSMKRGNCQSPIDDFPMNFQNLHFKGIFMDFPLPRLITRR